MDIIKNKKVDLRIRRTYKLLLEALEGLINEQPFEKITVTDICDRAMVHRTTFYKHFEDKYHLLRFGIKEIQEQFNEEAFQTNEDSTLHEHCLMIFETLLTLMKNNKDLHILVSFSRRDDSIGSVFFNSITEDISYKIKKINAKGTNVPSAFIASFYAGAIISTVNWWFGDGMKTPIDEMVRYMDMQITVFDC